MKLPLPKLKAIILYFATYTDPRFLGKVKLMKLFYFLDFIHLKKYGAPVTYDTYVNLEHGPIPTEVKNLVDTADDDVDNSVLADTVRFHQPEGMNMHRVIVTRPFNEQDKRYFSQTELEVLAIVCHRFGNKTTKDVEEAAHKEAPWRETRLLETISYTLATKDDDCLVSEEEIKAILSIAS